MRSMPSIYYILSVYNAKNDLRFHELVLPIISVFG